VQTIQKNQGETSVFLDGVNFSLGLRYLTARDLDLAAIVERLGPPPMWEREPGFPTLMHIILEQQVSLASARAAYQRLLAAVSPLTPERFLVLEDSQLKTIGFSRQKTAYGRNLARSIIEGELDVSALDSMNDATVRRELMKITGIGRWTADIYLLMALRRADVWPDGDLALAVAVQKIKKLERRPVPEELTALSSAWRPWRAVAARILWHYYLSKPV
jgi:DNA-3-methyladenine glycosylase II